MDILKIGLSIYMTIMVLSVATNIATVGRPREPTSAASAAAIFIINIPFFIMFLVIWTRL